MKSPRFAHHVEMALLQMRELAGNSAKL